VRATDTQFGHDAGDLAWRLDAAGRIERCYSPAGDGCQQFDAGCTPRRTSVDRRLLINDCLGIGLAPAESALRALGLRQHAINLPDQFVTIGLVQIARLRAAWGRIAGRQRRWRARQTQACSLMKSLIWGRTRVRQRRPLKMP
jgi:hypothetical protein